MSEPAAPGEVVLVGGGPGDPDLITVAGLRAVRAADVVFADRLAPDLSGELRDGARLVRVGKWPGHHPVPQEEIQRQMLAAARAGDRVVRLKGGDPFVFGRGGEELLACRRAGVPVRVVPGITSAVSVPGAAGVPVTFRDMSRGFTVVSGHVPFDDDELTHLAGLGSSGATIVVLMGMATLPQTVTGLMRHGLPVGTALAVIERGYTDGQRVTVTTLAEAVVDTSAAGCTSPAVIVVGPVVHALGGEPSGADSPAGSRPGTTAEGHVRE